ncbi:MAG: SAM-dependent methyltransferase [Pirellulaceae bacterium]
MKTSDDELLSPQAAIDALGGIELPSDELSDFVSSLQQRHVSVMRIRRDLVDVDLPFATERVDWYSLGRRLTHHDDRPSRHLAYAAGDYYLQDAGSLLALAACGADQVQLAGMTVCDLCAAPGGKASGLLEAIGETGFLLANEPIRSRLAPLAFNLARVGSDRYAISCQDPERLAATLAGQFDLVVVDAPCSGQALMGRGKQTVAAMSEKQIQHSAARQERILDAAVELLRPGGRLIYSTCTFARAENESQMDRLIACDLARPDPIERLSQYASGEGTYRLWPHRHDCAGSFAASMVAPLGGGEPEIGREKRVKRKKKKDRDKDDARVLASVPWGDWYDGIAKIQRLKLTDSVIYGWPSDVPTWVEDISVDGPELAHRTGQTWKPAHAGAMRRAAGYVGKQSVEVNGTTASQFLSGDTIGCPSNGWHVVRYQQRPLGWIKASNGVGKNQLPAAARFNGTLDH